MQKQITFVGLIAVTVMVGLGSVAAETTLKAVSFIPSWVPIMWGTTAWTKEVNAALKGELKINYVGGPEIIARFEQHEALKNGVLDIGFVVGSDIQDVIPEAQGQVLSKLHPSEERESGFYDYMDKLYQERMNIKVIGRMAMSPFYLWLRNKPDSLADLKGVKMRTAGLYDRLMQNFGMIPVTMNSPELFNRSNAR